MTKEEAVSALLSYAKNRCEHNNGGQCPGQVEGFVTRDPACRVCQAIVKLEAKFLAGT